MSNRLPVSISSRACDCYLHIPLINNQYFWSVSVWITTMPPATQQSLADYALLTLLYFHSFFILFYFCPDSHKLLDNLLNVKQASDMPAVQKSRHRIDPDAIPSPVSLLSACLFLRFTLSSPLACTHSQLPPRLLSSPLRVRDMWKLLERRRKNVVNGSVIPAYYHVSPV